MIKINKLCISFLIFNLILITNFHLSFGMLPFGKKKKKAPRPFPIERLELEEKPEDLLGFHNIMSHLILSGKETLIPENKDLYKKKISGKVLANIQSWYEVLDFIANFIDKKSPEFLKGTFLEAMPILKKATEDFENGVRTLQEGYFQITLFPPVLNSWVFTLKDVESLQNKLKVIKKEFENQKETEIFNDKEERYTKEIIDLLEAAAKTIAVTIEAAAELAFKRVGKRRESSSEKIELGFAGKSSLKDGNK